MVDKTNVSHGAENIFEFQMNFDLLSERIRKVENASVAVQKDVENIKENIRDNVASKEDIANLKTDIISSQIKVLLGASGLGITALIAISIGLINMLFFGSPK